MKTAVYLNAGFGQLIGGSTLQLIDALGFVGVRQDVPPGMEHELVGEFRTTRLRPLFLVNGGHMPEGPDEAGRRAAHVARVMRDLGVDGAIEVGNEPNSSNASRYHGHPHDAARSAVVAYETIMAEGLPARVVLGGIMTTDEGGLEYLNRMVRAGLPSGVIIGFHTYRTTMRASDSFDGFTTRSDEFRHLLDIAGGRELWNTEIGWHTAKSKTGKWCFSKTVQWTDQEVAEFLAIEKQYCSTYGIKVMTVFQLNDGPGDHYEQRFGIRTVDGRLKPSARIAEA